MLRIWNALADFLLALKTFFEVICFNDILRPSILIPETNGILTLVYCLKCRLN